MPLVTPFKSQARLEAENVIACEVNVPRYADAGGLMSYGTSTTDADLEVGAFTGRLFKGAKPEDLPIVQWAKSGISSLGPAFGAPKRLPGTPRLSTISCRNRRAVPVAREQRKLAAILAADVVGYSRLMGAMRAARSAAWQASQGTSPAQHSHRPCQGVTCPARRPRSDSC
jgi:hypothetical protein